MRTILFLICVLLNTLIFEAQNDSIIVYKIDYERKITPKNSTKSFIASLQLKTYPSLYVSVFDKEESSKNIVANTPDDDASFFYTPKGKNISCLFKDYNNNEMFNKQEVSNKYFTIKDSLNIFNWEIKGDIKEILGFKCQLATMTFRDRDYSAWFSPELPIGGPWKYDGLPGMILSIKSETPFIEFEAKGIVSRKIAAKPVHNPFENDKKITWSEYKNLYKKKAIELSNYSPEKGLSSGIILQRKGIERYIEEDDMEYMADKEFEKQLFEKQK